MELYLLLATCSEWRGPRPMLLYPSWQNLQRYVQICSTRSQPLQQLPTKVHISNSQYDLTYLTTYCKNLLPFIIVYRLNKQQNVIHVKNSGTKLKYYYNETSAKRISTFAKCDLQAFGYPEWNGTNAEKYLRSLRQLPMTTDAEQKFGCYVDDCESVVEHSNPS